MVTEASTSTIQLSCDSGMALPVYQSAATAPVAVARNAATAMIATRITPGPSTHTLPHHDRCGFDWEEDYSTQSWSMSDSANSNLNYPGNPSLYLTLRNRQKPQYFSVLGNPLLSKEGRHNCSRGGASSLARTSIGACAANDARADAIMSSAEYPSIGYMAAPISAVIFTSGNWAISKASKTLRIRASKLTRSERAA